MAGGSAADTAVCSDVHGVCEVSEESEGGCGGVGEEGEWWSGGGRGGGEGEGVAVHWG